MNVNIGNVGREDLARPIARARTADGPHRLVDVAIATTRQTLTDDIPELSAALAFRWFLAFFPLLIFVGAVGGFVASALHIQNPADQLVTLAGKALPAALAPIVRTDLRQIVDQGSARALTLGALFALAVATGGTMAVMRATNQAYDVPEGRSFVHRGALGIGLTVLGGVGVLFAFFLVIAADVLGRHVQDAVGAGPAVGIAIDAIRMLVAFVLLVAAGLVLYRVAPNLKLRWRTVVPGALLFAFGWLVVSVGLAIYVTTFTNLGSTYGMFAGVVILLLWSYLTALVLLVGAELNAVLAEIEDPAEIERGRQLARAEHERREAEARRKTGIDVDRDAATDSESAAEGDDAGTATA
jgi:membrane protein